VQRCKSCATAYAIGGLELCAACWERTFPPVTARKMVDWFRRGLWTGAPGRNKA